MAKKNMDLLVSNIMGNSDPIPQLQVAPTAEQQEPSPTEESKDVTDEPWKHFSFICSIELIDKVQAIAHKEGFTIRAFMEYMMRHGIAQYEAKHGKARKIKVKAVKDVM